jgi:hypothetical protein
MIRAAQHIKSGRWYLVLSCRARSVLEPQQTVVAYRQLYESHLRTTDKAPVVLPFGSVWTRPSADFDKAFRIASLSESLCVFVAQVLLHQQCRLKRAANKVATRLWRS